MAVIPRQCRNVQLTPSTAEVHRTNLLKFFCLNSKPQVHPQD